MNIPGAGANGASSFFGSGVEGSSRCPRSGVSETGYSTGERRLREKCVIDAWASLVGSGVSCRTLKPIVIVFSALFRVLKSMVEPHSSRLSLP